MEGADIAGVEGDWEADLDTSWTSRRVPNILKSDSPMVLDITDKCLRADQVEDARASLRLFNVVF